MSLFQRLAGVIGTFFQIGGPAGPGLNDNAGALEAKNSTNAAFVNLRCLDPVNPNDAVTLEYIQTAPSSGVLTLTNYQTHKVRWLSGETPAYNNATPVAGQHDSGWSTITFSNTVLVPSPATTTTKLGATKRLRFSTALTTPTICGMFESGYINAGVAQWGAWRGNAANRGGFLYRARFSITSIGSSSVIHMFVGLAEGNNTGSVNSGTFDWTTDTTSAKVGIGFTCTTTAVGAFPVQNWQAIESGLSAPHLTDLGGGFALTVNDFIEVIMYAAADDTKVSITVNNLTSGATNSVTLNTNLPANTTFMYYNVQLGLGSSVSGTNALDLSLIYAEHFDG